MKGKKIAISDHANILISGYSLAAIKNLLSHLDNFYEVAQSYIKGALNEEDDPFFDFGITIKDGVKNQYYFEDHKQVNTGCDVFVYLETILNTSILVSGNSKLKDELKTLEEGDLEDLCSFVWDVEKAVWQQVLLNCFSAKNPDENNIFSGIDVNSLQLV
jgi:hypothetical protein